MITAEQTVQTAWTGAHHINFLYLVSIKSHNTVAV